MKEATKGIPMRVEQAMTVGRDRYSEALAELAQIGRSDFTQTGGMCAALEVQLERGYLLVTDAEDSLPWNPDDLAGWGVGFYWSTDVSEGPEAFADTPDTGIGALRAAVEQCLSEMAGRLGAARRSAPHGPL